MLNFCSYGCLCQWCAWSQVIIYVDQNYIRALLNIYLIPYPRPNLFWDTQPVLYTSSSPCYRCLGMNLNFTSTNDHCSLCAVQRQIIPLVTACWTDREKITFGTFSVTSVIHTAFILYYIIIFSRIKTNWFNNLFRQNQSNFFWTHQGVSGSGELAWACLMWACLNVSNRLGYSKFIHRSRRPPTSP